MMTKLQVRALLYGVIAGGQTLMLGINEGEMTARDWIQLSISAVVAAAISIRALYDTAPDNLSAAPATATDGRVDRSGSTSPTGAVDNSKNETTKVEVKP